MVKAGDTVTLKRGLIDNHYYDNIRYIVEMARFGYNLVVDRVTDDNRFTVKGDKLGFLYSEEMIERKADMTKSDMRMSDEITLRNGRRFTYVDMQEDLTCSHDKGYDVMEVFRNGKSIWKRTETRKMTVAEACEKLREFLGEGVEIRG